jgi:hypothetical protein
MRFFRNLAVTIAVSSVFLLTAAPAHAGEEESRTLFAEGRRLREQGKCAEAIIMFRKSLETYPEGLGAMRNAAECEEQIGRLASARRTYRDLELAVQRAGQARYEGWEVHALEAQKRLEPRVPKMKIVLVGEGRVLVNGRPFDPRLLGIDIEQDTGPMEVVLEDDAAVPFKKSLVLEEGKRYVVELESRTRKEGGGGAGGAGGGPTGAGGGTTSGPNEDGPSGLFVGGIAGMGAAIGIRQSALSDLESACPSYETARCPRSVEGDVSTGDSASLAVNILAAVGGAGVATGAILLIVDATSGPDPAPSKTGSLRFGATPLPGGGYLGVGGTF